MNGAINHAALTSFIDDTTDQILARSRLEAGDILFSIAGTIGKTALVESRDLPANVNQALAIVRGTDLAMSPRFLLYCLQSSVTQTLASKVARGGAMDNISLADIKTFQVPIPPKKEQDRIVAEIEKQFTRLDAAVAALNRVQANLKRYRASVLKAAVEGRLVPTEAELARREGRSYEPASELLKRIASSRNSVRGSRGTGTPACAPPPNGIQLPEGWAWAVFQEITENFDGRRVPLKSEDRDKRPGAYPYYGASGVIDDIDDYIFDGDFLLIGEDGANLLARSTPIAFRASGRFWVNNHVHVIKTRGGISLNYIETFLNGKDLRFHVTGSAQPKLTQASMNRLPVPLPPLAEQQRIVSEVERRLSILEAFDALLTGNLQRSARLRQSILKRAFEGKLVPQDPNDEPASVLLDRIRASRAASSAARPGNARGASGNHRPRKPRLEAKL